MVTVTLVNGRTHSLETPSEMTDQLYSVALRTGQLSESWLPTTTAEGEGPHISLGAIVEVAVV